MGRKTEAVQSTAPGLRNTHIGRQFGMTACQPVSTYRMAGVANGTEAAVG